MFSGDEKVKLENTFEKVFRDANINGQRYVEGIDGRKYPEYLGEDKPVNKNVILDDVFVITDEDMAKASKYIEKASEGQKHLQIILRRSSRT